ncbi:MAG: hypothetical protein K0V04_00505 [Deltaproteobacteria bacterium]|nr:hypothetical protein [Deltaproteobacteria bacterium]
MTTTLISHSRTTARWRSTAAVALIALGVTSLAACVAEEPLDDAVEFRALDQCHLYWGGPGGGASDSDLGPEECAADCIEAECTFYCVGDQDDCDEEYADFGRPEF